MGTLIPIMGMRVPMVPTVPTPMMGMRVPMGMGFPYNSHANENWIGIRMGMGIEHIMGVGTVNACTIQKSFPRIR